MGPPDSCVQVASLPIDDSFGQDVLVHNLAFDPEGEHLVATTGRNGTVQAWLCQSWEWVWEHDYGGGNAGALWTSIDDRSERVWVWGMTDHTPAGIDLATGRVVVDLAGRDLGMFAPSPDGRTIAARHLSALVVLETDGRARIERIDLGDLGAVVSHSDGGVSGDERALPHVFVRDGDSLVRADDFVMSRAGEER